MSFRIRARARDFNNSLFYSVGNTGADGAVVDEPFLHEDLTIPGDLTSFGEDGEGELSVGSTDNVSYKIMAAP